MNALSRLLFCPAVCPDRLASLRFSRTAPGPRAQPCAQAQAMGCPRSPYVWLAWLRPGTGRGPMRWRILRTGEYPGSAVPPGSGGPGSRPSCVSYAPRSASRVSPLRVCFRCPRPKPNVVVFLADDSGWAITASMATPTSPPPTLIPSPAPGWCSTTSMYAPSARPPERNSSRDVITRAAACAASRPDSNA